MVDVIGIARDYSREVIVDIFSLEDANKVLSKLKVSDIRLQAVLLLHNYFVVYIRMKFTEESVKLLL